MQIKVVPITRWRLRAVLLAALFLLVDFGHGQIAYDAVALRVLVLDGNNGKPVRGREVEITSPRNEMVKGRTNSDGVFSVTGKFPENINVFVIGRPRCTEKKTATTSLVKVEDIVTRGVVESNSCNSNVKRSALPGTLTLFVRHETVAEILDLR